MCNRYPGVSAIFVPETPRGQDQLYYIMTGDARNWRDMAFMALEDILRGQIHDSRLWSISPHACFGCDYVDRR